MGNLLRIFGILCFILCVCFAQTIRVPVQTDQFVEIPLPTNGNTVIITNTYYVVYYVTNTVNITNWFTITNSLPRHVVNMPGTIIQPVDSQTDLSKTILGPTSFWLGNFLPDQDVVIWLSNPGSNQITWPSNVRLPYGPLPTNAGLACIWFKNVNGIVWAMP